MAEPRPARRKKGDAPRERSPAPASAAPVRVSPWLFVPVALAAGALGHALAPSPRAAPAPTSASSTSASPGPSDQPSPPASAPPSLGASAIVMSPEPAASSASAHLARLKAIEAKPAKSRTIEENLELERGHVALGAEEVAEIERALGPKFDVALARRLRLLARDAAIAPEALAAIARHPRAELADLLYDVANDADTPDGVRWLAIDLLAAEPVRATASMALLLALDIPNVRDCETMKTFVARAKNSADERSSAALRRLEREDGCGVDGKGDCWACLRGDTLLYETRTAVDARAYSPPWRMVGR